MIEQEIIFSKNECDEIISFHSEYNRDQHYNNSSVNQNDILYEASVLPKNPRTIFVFQKLFDFFEKKSKRKLYRYPTEVFIMRYGKGDKFMKHSDTLSDRIYSVGIQLTDQYNGGEYLVYKNDSFNIISREIGNTYFMESSTLHEIKEIQSGVRYSLVAFIHKTDLIEEKSKSLI